MNNGHVWTVWVDYLGSEETLEVRLTQDSERPNDALITASVNLLEVFDSQNAYVGFTSGTGGAAGDHDILSFFFNDDYLPITTLEVNDTNDEWDLDDIAGYGDTLNDLFNDDYVSDTTTEVNEPNNVWTLLFFSLLLFYLRVRSSL